MSVYVDDMRAPFGRMMMCHMIADSTAELFRMADSIGVSRKWVQYRGDWKEHFDICLAKRELALKYGAVELSQYELVRRQLKRRRTAMRAAGGAR